MVHVVALLNSPGTNGPRLRSSRRASVIFVQNSLLRAKRGYNAMRDPQDGRIRFSPPSESGHGNIHSLGGGMSTV